MKIHSREQVEATANSIMKHFIPKDPLERKMSFHFTIPPSSNYRVSYEMTTKDEWKFIGFEADESR